MKTKIMNSLHIIFSEFKTQTFEYKFILSSEKVLSKYNLINVEIYATIFPCF